MYTLEGVSSVANFITAYLKRRCMLAALSHLRQVCISIEIQCNLL